MTTIQGERLTTVTAAAGEIYEIVYAPYPRVDVSNLTSGSVYVSDANDFDISDGAGRYVEISEGGAYNGLPLRGNKLYIKADSAGSVVIVRCG